MINLPAVMLFRGCNQETIRTTLSVAALLRRCMGQNEKAISITM